MPGEPTYIELGVPDADAARAFYGELPGWRPAGDDGNVTTPTLDIGLHGGDPAAEMLVFLAVDDLDDSLRRLDDLGGRLHGDVVDDEGFGRFAICSDDQGVRFGLRQVG